MLVYTRLLKRSTPQNIVIGGAAGAVPPLVGWAAATGDLTWPALVLFGVVFLWTPPHFWALALLIKRNYAAAGVPMLPVVRGEDETTKQIVLYTVALVAFTHRARAVGPVRARLPRGGSCAGRHLPRPRLGAAARADTGPGQPPVPLLAPLPGAPLRRHGARHGDRVSERPAEPYVLPREPTLEDAPSNALFGLGLFAIALLIFAGTIGVGLVYLALD